MRTEPATAQTIAAKREMARQKPATGLPELAQELMAFGWQIGRDKPADRIPYFEEAAAIYRDLIISGSGEYLRGAADTISSLALQYSLAHADDRSLIAKTEAAHLARRMNQRKNTEQCRFLFELACGLAEAGRFGEAVTTQVEVTDLDRAANGPDDSVLSDTTMWALHDLAIYLDLDGQAEASLDIDRELIALERSKAQAEPRRLTELAIWTAGLGLRFLDAGHLEEAQGLLDGAIDACDRLPPEAGHGNFGFHRALQAAIFARSGTRDERTGLAPANPITDPGLRGLQPVLGLSYHHWSFSVRDAYGAGHEAINDRISILEGQPGLDPAKLAELGTLTRRRNIRQSVRFGGVPGHFIEQTIPTVTESVDIERRLLAAMPDHGHHRLIQALTDQAMGYLTIGSNAMAATALREARHLLETEDHSR